MDSQIVSCDKNINQRLTHMNSKRLEMVVTTIALVSGAAFLLKMCYMSLAFNCVFGLVFLTVIYVYFQVRQRLQIPLVLLALVFAALEVDALGNYFHMYGQMFGPLQYDEFSHMTVQVLVTPVFVWLMRETLNKWDYELPIKLTAFFSATIVFSMSAFYEIIELWDEVYFGGHRIWGPHDTASDLQFDLCGIIVGSVLANILLKVIQTRARLSLQRSRA